MATLMDWSVGFDWPALVSLVALLAAILGLVLRYFARRQNASQPDASPPTLGGRVRRAPQPRRAPESQSPTSSRPPADDVWCTAFAPAAAAPGDNLLVQVFAHRRAAADAVRMMAADFDPSTGVRGTTRLTDPVERGTELTFCLSIKDAAVEPPVQHLIWHGEPEAVQFSVSLREHVSVTRLIGTIYVTQGTVPCGHVKFVIQLLANPRVDARPSVRQASEFRQYRHAFVSYASADRTEVLKRVQMLSRLSIEFFQDLLSLDPGERWERSLYRNIDKSDVFFLFWSNHAKNSAWVLKEVHYALERKAGDEFAAPEIVPIIIEGPPPPSPPPELAHLHFNDALIYFMQPASPP